MAKTDEQVREEMEAAYAANRAHNMEAFEASDMPRAARRGIRRATQDHAHRIASIERRDSTVAGRKRSCWIVKIEGGPFTREGWIVGPRGAATKAY